MTKIGERERLRLLREMETRHAAGLTLLDPPKPKPPPVVKPWRDVKPRRGRHNRGSVVGMYRLGTERPRVRPLDRVFNARCVHCGTARVVVLKRAHLLVCPCQHQIVVEGEKLIGRRFGRLIVMRVDPSRMHEGQGRYVICRCRCGNERSYRVAALNAKRAKSCGCAAKEKPRSPKGDHKSPEYSVWLQLRCGSRTPSASTWKRLGAKGLKLCDLWWNSFERFLADVGHQPRKGYGLYRIDTNKDFEPGNVAWMTKQERAHLAFEKYTVDGVTDTKRGLCRHFGLSLATVRRTMRVRSLSFEDAVQTCYAKKALQIANALSK